MEFIVGILGNLVSELISSTGKFLFADLTDDVSWKQWKAEHHLSKNQNDFLDRYAETLVTLKNQGKDKALLLFYAEKSVITLIHDYWYQAEDSALFEEKFSRLTEWFTLDRQLQGFSPRLEIAAFLKVFAETVNQNRTAGETELFQKLSDIWNAVRGEATLVSIPKHITRIPTIDLRKEFLGRQADMQRLKDTLEDSSKVVLMNGLGGIGKTALATAYIQQYGDEYDHLIWINQGEDIVEAIALNPELADHLALPFQQEEELADRFGSILRKIQHIIGRNLLVIDNAQEQVAEKQIYTLLPGQPNWQVLLTSRLSLSGFDLLPLDVLDPKAAKSLFQTYYQGPCTEDELDALLKEVGYHTLTVELLAKLLDKLNYLISVSELTTILQQRQLDNPDLQEKIWTRHSVEERGTYLHLMKAFELSQLEEEERWLLKQFVVLPVEPYSVPILADFFQRKPIALNKILNSLATKGWLILHKEKTFSIHRLLQQVAEYQLLPDFTDVEKLVESLIQKVNTDIYTDQSTTASWLKYALKIADFFAASKQEPIANLYNNIATTYIALGQSKEALGCMMKAMMILELLLDPQHPYLATSYNNVAVAHSGLRQDKEALYYHQKALAIRESILNDNHPDLSASYICISSVHIHLGQHNEGLSYLTKAVAILESRLDAKHPYLATCYNNIATVNHALAQYNEALDYSQKALVIRESVFNDTNHPDLATSYNNLAEIYYALEQYDKSLQYHHKARVVLESLVGAKHPNLATCYSNIALTYRYLGQYEKALDYIQKALVIRESVFNDTNHPDLAKSYNHIALIYNDMGQIEKANAYKEKEKVIHQNRKVK